MLYDDVETFYNALPAELRRRSPEIDYGCWWWDGPAGSSGQYRVTFVENSGELIAVKLNTVARRLMTPDDGEVLAISAAPHGAVEVLGKIDGREEVDRVLDGWADICGSDSSLGWVRGQLERAVQRTA